MIHFIGRNFPFTLPVFDRKSKNGKFKKGSNKIYVRNIYCVGQNYRAHAHEMGVNPKRDDPVFFRKPTDSLIPEGGFVKYPKKTKNLQFEVELVTALKGKGENLSLKNAKKIILGYAVGIDLTRRDLQKIARKKGMPWDMAKGFPGSAPCSAIVTSKILGHPTKGEISLKVNNKIKQKSDISKLIWSVPQIIAKLSNYTSLYPGDIIFTGTPEGVGRLKIGDYVEGMIEQIGKVSITIK